VRLDLVANNSIRSGKIMPTRDATRCWCSADQLDALAAGMASALSDKTTSGTAVTGLADSTST
jgi:flagellar hook-associated protein 1 FlgK